MKKDIGSVLREKRIEAGLTVREVSANLTAKGYKASDKTIYSWENGNSQPSLEALLELCDMYDIKDILVTFGYDGYNEDGSIQLNVKEQDIIEKYRSLDSCGQETVNYILDKEVGRVQVLAERDNTIRELKGPFHIPQPPAVRYIQYFQRLASAGTGQIVLDDIPVDTLMISDIPKYRKVKYAIGVHGNSMEPDYKDGDIVLIAPNEEVAVGEIGIFMNNSDAFIKKRGKSSLISLNPEYKDIPLTSDTRCCGLVIDKYQPVLDEKDIAAFEEAHDILFGGDFLEKLLG